MTEPTAPPPPAAPPSNRPTIALVLGILGLLCCQLLAPVAWYLGSQEVKAIRAGRAPAAGEGTAKAGMILGIIGTVFLIFLVLWILFWGGMAVVGGLMGGAS